MPFYVLTQKKEPGCPLGMLAGNLFLEAHKSDYGDLPWYANADGPHRTPFPSKLCFITDDKKYSFDIRGSSRFFYLASASFIGLCEKMNVRFEDRARVDVLSRHGEPVSKLSYWVCRFMHEDIADAVDPEHSVLEVNDEVTARIRRLLVRADFNPDLFKLNSLPADIDTLFCSERFMRAATERGFRGITFTDVESFKWPPKLTAAERYLAMANGADAIFPI